MITLDSILLFALLIPFIMTYRISPGTTPFWLFGLIFLGLFAYIIVGTSFFSIKEAVSNRVKLFILWLLIFLTIGAGVFSAIIVRHQTAPIFGVHDIILQQEAAIKFFLHGTNPYATTYFHTPMADWHYSDTEVNPALYHFVMEPWYLLFPVPFYLFMGHTIGFFDARVPLFLLFIALLVIAYVLPKDAEKKRLYIILLAFNPAMLGYFLEGRDDVFMFAFLLAGFYFLLKKKISLSGIFIALAFATKQSVWPLFPFYFFYLYFNNQQVAVHTAHKKKMLSPLLMTVKQFIPFTVTFFCIVLPFFFWNPSAFLDSTILYLSGSSIHSYPVAGYGLGVLLNSFGFITDVHAYYPFWIWQVIFCLPLLIVLIQWQKKENSLQRVFLVYGLFLFVFWYMSRYFNNSHLGYLSMVFITAYFWPKEEKKIGNSS